MRKQTGDLTRMVKERSVKASKRKDNMKRNITTGTSGKEEMKEKRTMKKGKKTEMRNHHVRSWE